MDCTRAAHGGQGLIAFSESIGIREDRLSQLSESGGCAVVSGAGELADGRILLRRTRDGVLSKTEIGDAIVGADARLPELEAKAIRATATGEVVLSSKAIDELSASTAGDGVVVGSTDQVVVADDAGCFAVVTAAPVGLVRLTVKRSSNSEQDQRDVDLDGACALASAEARMVPDGNTFVDEIVGIGGVIS